MSGEPEFSGILSLKERIDDPAWQTFKTICVIVASFSLITCHCLCSGLWSFERYGGDPQKRTILNQLFGQLTFYILLCNLASLSTFIIRLIVGTVSILMAELTFFIAKSALATACLFTLIQMVFIRCMSIFVWKRLPPMNDNFFGRFFLVLNLGLSFLSAVIARMGSSDDKEMYFILTGHPFLSNSTDPVFRFHGSALILTVLSYIIYGVLQLWLRYKAWKVKKISVAPMDTNVDDDGNQSYNNASANSCLASFSINAMSLASYLVYIYSVSSRWQDNDIQPAVVGYLLSFFIATVAMPLKTWIANPEIWVHVKSGLWINCFKIDRDID